MDFRPKWLSAELELHVLGSAIKIKAIQPKEDAKSVADAIRQAGDSARSALSAQSTGGPGSGRRSTQEIAEAIRELGTLRGEGLLTEDEFERQKAALLGEM
ncbi:MAG: SHOCT domain-containing protein [Actinomycetota bacterium]